MNTWEEHNDHCPYCGEPISLLIDCSETEQSYVEDCEVCCRPIEIQVSITLQGELQVALNSDNAT